ncbi:hypothetical protein HWV23_02630 [Natronomonas halophila]|uniref:cyclin family protein n=1 Tax=Natronomonas halophila TaxID=2747817 RepID=UPI0015B5D8FF|nr:cyclin family protein [Natronomonas halophila]QLD84596.1 hypothetical protein HWV23_02345 [Natronomonas halophila]QLD84652.1 hypothetical protein HWV23_02630 [Natronomonas halophila]
MRNQESRARNYDGPTTTEEQSRASARADTSDAAASSKSKDQTGQGARLPSGSEREANNTCGPTAWDHVVLAKLASRTKKYHLPAEDDPSKPRCHHGTRSGRAIDAESWTQVDADSPRLQNKTLCKWCDPSVEVENNPGGPELAGKLEDLDPDDVEVLTDGGVDTCTPGAEPSVASAEELDALSSVNIELVHDICEVLELSQDATERATAYACRAWMEHPINGPAHHIAAGAVYFAALMENEKRTQEDVAKASGSNPSSIRKYYREIGVAEDILEPKPESEDEPAETTFSDRVVAALKEVFNR